VVVDDVHRHLCEELVNPKWYSRRDVANLGLLHGATSHGLLAVEGAGGVPSLPLRQAVVVVGEDVDVAAGRSHQRGRHVHLRLMWTKKWRRLQKSRGRVALDG